MTCVFMEGFDNANTNALLTAKGGGGVNNEAFQPGRYGGSSAYYNSGGSRQMSLPGVYTTFYMGWGFYSGAAGNCNNLNIQTAAGGNIITLSKTSANNFYWTNNVGGGQIGPNIPWTNGVWQHLQIKLVVHASAGSLQVKLNGVDIINVTGLNTGSTGVGKFNMASQSDNTDVRFDDIWCDDAAFLGDCRIETLIPNGNGNSSMLVGSDGNSTDNYLLVDEAVPNTADYVESSTVGDKDTYAFGNLATVAGVVQAVQISAYAAKTDAGTRLIKTVARLSTTEEDSADQALSAGYVYPLRDLRVTKPGGGAWTIADVNNAEFGVKVSA